MPKLLCARPAAGEPEERQVRRLARSRHAPCAWIRRAYWTLTALTTAAQHRDITVARSQVRRILLAERVRWRQPRSRTTSADPDFASRRPRSSRSMRPLRQV
jgi:transposase